MDTKDKIKYIEKFTGLVFSSSGYDTDYSYGSVSSFLFDNKIISQEIYNKIKIITGKTNFFGNFYLNKPLNSYSILFVNLVYNIIKEHEKVHN
jgi:hypothetical protein